MLCNGRPACVRAGPDAAGSLNTQMRTRALLFLLRLAGCDCSRRRGVMLLQEKLRLKARSERFKDHLAGLPTATTGNSKPAASSASDIEAKKKVAHSQVLKSGHAAIALGTACDVVQGCISSTIM